VLRPGQSLILVLLALVGCSTAPRRVESPRAPDWTVNSQETPTPPAVYAPLPASILTNLPAPPPTVHAIPAPIPALASAPKPAPAQHHYAETWIPMESWVRDNRGSSLRQLTFAPSPGYVVTTGTGMFLFHIGSPVASWNGVELHLGFAPRIIDEKPCLHVLDLEKNLDPLLQPLVLPAPMNRVIVIDPGHGGANFGTRSVVDGEDEKTFTLDWAGRLAALLRAKGWQVFLTRTNDIDVPLPERAAIAGQHKADLFISLHFNSPGTASASSDAYAGVETYCLTPTGMPSTLTRGYEDVLSSSWPNNAADTRNVQYAVRLHAALLRVDGMTDRGVRRARFMGVLRGQSDPAVLIEGGYLSNPREARRIADPAYRQQLAEALARALTEGAMADGHKEIGPGLKLNGTAAASTTGDSPTNQFHGE
jgi:N-acetylmuramoyl-L-alanine amidase